MMHLFLNALGASTSSGLTYVRNVAPLLSTRAGLYTTIAAGPLLQKEFLGLPNLSFASLRFPNGAAKRFWMEQTVLPRLIRRASVDVVVSAGNFALWHCPVPQILLSGNSLYTSNDFYDDLRRRRAYGLWLDTRIKGHFARQSIQWADYTVAPSKWFAAELERWSGRSVGSIYHGFGPDVFFGDDTPLSPEVRQKLDQTSGALRLLFVSHYNYYRNFETLFRALPLIRAQLGQEVRLLLTSKLGPGGRAGGYRSNTAAKLIQELGTTNEIVELGEIPYRSLHHVYKASDIYVTPAYAETFAHPLVEAMASGVPVVASDLPVHQEICDDAALFFARFSPEELAGKVLQLAQSGPLRKELVQKGIVRSRDFSWEAHVDALMDLAINLVLSNRPDN